MMWHIPAKTFLLGEYAALAGESAIVLTTYPCFELRLVNTPTLDGIHPESPAGVWWNSQNHINYGLSWHDPYNSCGGLGASSAQFLGAYLASCHLNNMSPDPNELMHAYYQVSWQGIGLKPSGYDVIAQAQNGCVFINKNQKQIHSYSWPFNDISFTLLHTGIKLATHHHLQQSDLPIDIVTLSTIVNTAHRAFKEHNSVQLIQAVNAYHESLNQLNLVAEHSLALIARLKDSCSEIRAIKGCGALGADMLLLISKTEDTLSLHQKLKQNNLAILSSERELYNQSPLL